MKKFSEYSEDITIPINVGDTVLGGKFKNKKMVVKDIGKNEKGDITINGRALLKFRIMSEAEDLAKNIHNMARQQNAELKASAGLSKNFVGQMEKMAENGELTKTQYEEFSSIVQDLTSGMKSAADIQAIMDDLGSDMTDEMRDYLEGQKEIASINERNKSMSESIDDLTGGMASKAKDFIGQFAKDPLSAMLLLATKIHSFSQY